MKKAIAWAVCRQQWSSGLRVVTVTSRKPNGRIYGRSDDLEATNVAARDVRAFYGNVDAARAAVSRAEAAFASFGERLADLDRQERAVRAEQKSAVTAALVSPDRIP